MLYRGEHLLDSELCAQLAQLLTRELGVVFGHQVFWDPKTTADVPPYEVLNPVGSYLHNWFGFYPLGEVPNGYH